MNLKPFNVGTLGALTRNITNAIHQCNIVDVFTIHKWQVECKTKPAKVLAEIISCLERIKEQGSKYSF